jgi:putative transposase
MRLRELAQARPRFGYLRLHVMLRREGWVVNRKRVHRIYREEGLTVRLTHRRKRTSHLRVVPPRPSQVNERGVWILWLIHYWMAGGFAR